MSDALDDLPDDLTITLRKPVKVGEVEYSELNLREPTAGELQEVARKSQDEAGIFLVSKISGVPIQAVKQITARDFGKATAFLLSFTGGGPTTGEQS